MAREIPEAVRAAAGLAATVLDEARKLPTTLTGLPVRLIGMAMQGSLRLQQQYSGLVARGDELFTGLRGKSEPGMATFDEELPPAGARDSAFDRVVELAEEPADDLTVELSDEIVDLADPASDVDGVDVVIEAAVLGLADDDPVIFDTPLAEVTGDAGSGEAWAEELTDEIVEELAEEAGLDSADDAPLADVLAFDTLAAEDGAGISDAEVATLPADPPADAVTEAVDELAGEVDAELAAELPASVADEVADDLAADTVATVADAEAAEAAEAAAPAPAQDAAPAGAPDEATVRDLGLVGTADATHPDTEIPDLGLPALDDTATDTTATEDTATDDTATTDAAAPEDTTTALAVPEDTTTELAIPQEGSAASAVLDLADNDTDTGAGAGAGAGDEGAQPEAAAGADATLLDDATPDVPALDDAAAEVVDLGASEPVVAQPDVAGGDVLPGVTGANAVTDDTTTDATTDATADATTDGSAGSGAAEEAATDETAGSDSSGTGRTPPIEGYDAFSIPTLRGRLRKFDVDTVRQLLDYERATQDRPPYVTMLSNRLDKLTGASH